MRPEDKAGLFTMTDLGMAYRKAKVDLYYSSNSALLKTAEYELDLIGNLEKLLEKINGDDEFWANTDEFVGDWTVVPKIARPAKLDEQGGGLVMASPSEKWKYECERARDSRDAKPTAEFRVMAQCSLDFHVLSALWISKVGHKYDKKLSNCAYGNRLRRGGSGEFNLFSLGSFKPYLRPFREWRDGGISAMQDALGENKRVVALTADVASFYHQLNPDFMLDKTYNKLIEVELTSAEWKLHRIFIRSIKYWSEKTPLKKGLPVGLPASAVIANMALIELDKIIEQQIVPLYYGRYVDDIILVMEAGADVQSTSALWEWLFFRSDKKLGWADGEKDKYIEFKANYLRESKIQFANSKNKVFLLEGDTGYALVNSIALQIRERASEWRALPNLPMSSKDVGTDLIAATQNDGETADNLRKTDALTMRRAGFALKLRDFEAYERDLPPGSWRGHRHAFFQAFIQHVLVLPQFFELAIYVPRIIRLATACEDFIYLSKIIIALKSLYRTVSVDCVISIKACDEALRDESIVLARWEQQLFSSIYESVLAAFPPKLTREGRTDWLNHMSQNWPIFWSGAFFSKFSTQSIREIRRAHQFLFSSDLAHMPFRFIGLPKEMVVQRGIPKRENLKHLENTEALVDGPVSTGTYILSEWIKMKDKLPLGLLFATRPFNLAEIFVLAPRPFCRDEQVDIRSVVLALRGFSINEKMPLCDSKNVLRIPDGEPTPKRVVAVSSWMTDYRSWIASVSLDEDPDEERYARLNRLVNTVIAQRKGVQYFILPELSLPAHWFLRLALKLQGRGISLITGIEYLHTGKRVVHNQVWAAMSHNGLGFPSLMIYRQDKQRAALHEERELQRIAGAELVPVVQWQEPPIIEHAGFRFSILICSELTNISYRASLRGKVDAIFVPEWNQDTETFESLVESSALDVHAYIVQCNNRSFGDSRIRAPSKDSRKRDILRVKGGLDDYCVTGEINVEALRAFQSSHRSPGVPFKPVPDGFTIDKARKVLPLE